jgi:ribosomal-protein-alanine N-acetyltransferase
MSARRQPAELPALRLRAMTVTDLDRVVDLEVQAYGFPWSRGHFTDSLAAGYLAQVFESHGALVGYFVAMPGVDELHLLNITVAPAFQGLGHGRALLAEVAESGRRLKAAQLWLEVRESNARARQLYERWGFETVGRRKGYYPAAHGQREHAIVMRLPLAPLPGAAP